MLNLALISTDRTSVNKPAGKVRFIGLPLLLFDEP
jgi:hypothetical protein